MAKFRKRIWTISAVQFDVDKPWPEGVEPGPKYGARTPWVVQTPEGLEGIVPGWWVLTDPMGGHWVMDDEAFRLAYEPVEDD
jgi:hypothetical protein